MSGISSRMNVDCGLNYGSGGDGTRSIMQLGPCSLLLWDWAHWVQTKHSLYNSNLYFNTTLRQTVEADRKKNENMLLACGQVKSLAHPIHWIWCFWFDCYYFLFFFVRTLQVSYLTIWNPPRKWGTQQINMKGAQILK